MSLAQNQVLILLEIRTLNTAPTSQSLGDCVQPVVIENLRLGAVKRAANGLMATHLTSAFPMVVNTPNQYLEGLLGIPQSEGETQPFKKASLFRFHFQPSTST